MDRIDLQIEILPVGLDDLQSDVAGEPSSEIRKRVIEARRIQTERFKDEPGIHCNAQMGPRHMSRYARLDGECTRILRNAMEKLDLSARAYDRILRVARTIADLDASPEIGPTHLREAISYRNLDRSSWGATLTKYNSSTEI